MDAAIEGFLYWLRVEKGRSEHTIAAYQHDASRFAAWLKERGVSSPGDVTAAHLSAHMGDLMAEGIEPPSLLTLGLRFAGICAVALTGLHYLGKHKAMFRPVWI